MNRPTHGGNIAWAAALAGCAPSLILDFSASINPLGPPKSAIAAIESHLKDLIAYPDPNYHQLRTALSQLHPTLTPDWILPGNGSAELLTWASRELSQLEETCLVTPAFSDYQRALRAFGAKVREYPLELQVEQGLQIGRLKVEGLEDHLLYSSRKELSSEVQRSDLQLSHLGLLLNNPHNPTGQLFDRETIEPLLKQFALVVVDEAFMDFLPPLEQQSLISVVQDYDNLVILRSLTKFYSLPGLRPGYCVAHPDRLSRFQQWRDPWPVNALAAAAAIAVVQDMEFQRQTWEWLPKVRSQLFQGLASLPGLRPYPSAANFLLVQSEQSSSQLQEKLLKHSQVLIRDCLSFPELGDRYFRVV
ncbi:MAG TPA: threonine-phosphate decarboxylase, partial [Cyanobacteria bacterium UBA8553]|nr:threonine-phosphate decarboxylase [Cyanobacteria bacterium UBA8553]